MALCKFSRQVIREDVNVDLEMLGHCILNILAELTITVQEADCVWLRLLFIYLSVFIGCGRLTCLLLCRDVGHKVKALVYPCYVLLNLCDIVLQDGVFYTLRASKSFHDSSVFIADITFNDLLNCLNLIKTSVQPNNLTNQLLPFWHNAGVNRLINRLKPVPESFFQVTDPMQLSVMRAHGRAVSTQQLLAGVAEEN